MNNNNPSPKHIATIDGQAFEIPAEGSLGLLALGYAGIKAWRQKQAEAKNTAPQPSTSPDTTNEK